MKRALGGVAATLGYAVAAVLIGLAMGIPAGAVGAALAGLLALVGVGTHDDLWWWCAGATWIVIAIAFIRHVVVNGLDTH